MTPESTNWDEYYKRPAALSGFARRISATRIRRTLGDLLGKDNLKVCELGGANSSFIDHFLLLPNLTTYDVIDQNAFGIELLRKKTATDPRVNATIADILYTEGVVPTYDITYSVGLIEHFDLNGTARCINAHFDLCRPGGAVLITFPTPTIPYRVIRGAAEVLGMWAFPDERPLSFAEVVAVCARRGRVVHQTINWAIGLTQGYVLTECGVG